MVKLRKIKNYFDLDVNRNKYLIFSLFIFSTSFFIYQHIITGISWDFSVYVLNAQYWFSNGFYFEWLRPPLASLFIGIFSIFGWGLAEYAYIIFTSLFYLYACLKFADNFLGKGSTLFYVLMLNPFTLLVGLECGTELLGLSLILLSISFFSKSEKKSGFLLALSSLARYTNLNLFSIAIFQKGFRKILLFLIVFSITILPWLFFNYWFTGHMLTSLGNFYALNVKFRDYLIQKFDPLHPLLAINFLLPSFLLGIFLKMKEK